MMVPELRSPLRHKQEKVMINEFNCALKPKTYTKIVQASIHEKYSIIIKLLSVQLELRELLSISGTVSARPLPITYLVGRTPFHGPAIQPIYQNVLEICLDVDNFYIG